MTLTDFLLARIAEDETVAHYDLGEAAAYESLAPGVTDGYRRERRVLAECDAKRRIIKMIQSEYEIEAAVGDGIYKALALPYADHPDYDEAWKP